MSFVIGPAPKRAVSAVDFGQDLLRLDRGSRSRKEAIDNQMRQSMNQTPRRHGREIVIERPLVKVGHAVQQQSFDACGRGLERRIFRPLGENGPEHEAKEAAMLVSELDVGKTRPAEGIRAAACALHRRGKLVETLGGDGSKEILLAGEMTVGGRRRHPDAAGGLAQSDRLQAILIQNLTSRGQKRSRQVAVAIGPSGIHSSPAYGAWFTV